MKTPMARYTDKDSGDSLLTDLAVALGIFAGIVFGSWIVYQLPFVAEYFRGLK